VAKGKKRLKATSTLEERKEPKATDIESSQIVMPLLNGYFFFLAPWKGERIVVRG
jgi:hypothetical protein